MSEKNERTEEEQEKEDKFTGSPEEQLPDLEGEGKKVPKDQQDQNGKNGEDDKDE